MVRFYWNSERVLLVQQMRFDQIDLERQAGLLQTSHEAATITCSPLETILWTIPPHRQTYDILEVIRLSYKTFSSCYHFKATYSMFIQAGEKQLTNNGYETWGLLVKAQVASCVT